MPTLTIRNVPENLHRRLKERARAHRRSLNAEALTMLDEAASAPDSLGLPTTAADAVRQIDALRASMESLPPELDPVRLLREDRDSDQRPA